MYTCYVAIVTSYSVKKDDLKKISQREITKQELCKRRHYMPMASNKM